MDRAAQRTEAFKKAKKFTEKSTDSIWGEVKAIFVIVQHNKCAYCERDMAGVEFGSAEYDLEHFRPKGRVLAWPGKKDRARYDFPTGTAVPQGYYWLAYEIGNYATACKSCNSGLKRDRFPIFAARANTEADIAALNASEQPLLIFPLGTDDQDPRALIGFIGAVPFAQATDEHLNRRAQVTIDFFHLADPKREELFRDRFQLIRNLWGQLKIVFARDSTPEEVADAQTTIDTLCSSRSGHSSCGAAFIEVFKQDTPQAFAIAREAAKYLAAPRNERITWL